MCGIVGFTGTKNLHKLNSLLDSIEHRGRDDRVLFWDNNIHLGMNRLAIMDLRDDLYPMKYKHYILIYNGEIYNYQQLRNTLKKHHISFKTTCDAEVILPLFHLYGEKAFTLLEGMFAICIYDLLTNRLILARDKSGEKPLYYTTDTEKFSFSSEIKALMLNRHNTLRVASLPHYFEHGFVHAPDTLVHTIKKICPSCFITIDFKKKTIIEKAYWKPLTTKPSIPSDEIECVALVDNLIRESVKRRLYADVPVGCFLSGGIDSSIIARIASQETQNLKTYSAIFPDQGTLNEADFSKYVASQIKSDHSEVICTPQKIRDLIEHIGDLIDEPIIDPAVLPTLLLSQEARKNVKVVLTGEGADELFGGYTRYKRELDIRFIQSVFSSTGIFKTLLQILPHHKFTKLRHSLTDRYSAQTVWNEFTLHEFLKKSFTHASPHMYLKKFGESNPLLAMQLADFRGYMAEQLLMKIDKSTMAYNLESRAPFLDTTIIDLALSLPDTYKIRGSTQKYILKKIAENYYPKSFVYRRKHGFDVPLRTWFAGELSDMVKESLSDMLQFKDIFNPTVYTTIVDEHLRRSRDNSGKIWSIIVLLNWMKVHDLTSS